MADIQLSISAQFRQALAVLIKAYDYAQDSGSDAWQFAVDLSELISRGATLPDLRWLILRKFAEHAKETTIPGDTRRSFRPLAPTCFPTDSCIALVPAGAAAVRSFLSRSIQDVPIDSSTALSGETATTGEVCLFPPHAVVDSTAEIHTPASSAAPPRPVKPVWDPAHRELRYDGKVVKRYRVPAHNQEVILEAFQEDDWPEFIDDPIPPDRDKDPKRRLNVTIKSLNHNQITPLLRFHGNGNGLQVHWEYVGPQK